MHGPQTYHQETPHVYTRLLYIVLCAVSLELQAWPSAIEYGLIAAGIAVLIIVGVNAVGGRLETLFNTDILTALH